MAGRSCVINNTAVSVLTLFLYALVAMTATVSCSRVVD